MINLIHYIKKGKLPPLSNADLQRYGKELITPFPGLPEFFKEQLGIETLLIDPVANLEINSRIKSEVAQLSTVGFTVAVGLALKEG